MPVPLALGKLKQDGPVARSGWARPAIPLRSARESSVVGDLPSTHQVLGLIPSKNKTTGCLSERLVRCYL